MGGLVGNYYLGMITIATAGGCFSSQYLAGWVIAITEGVKAAAALYYVASVGEKKEYILKEQCIILRNLLGVMCRHSIE